MKIKYLEIKNYKQFKDLSLDLTYPQGHDKAGEPLEKICIIGQSGTGKTNLLEIITKSTIDFSQQAENSYLPFSAFTGIDTDDRYITTKFITSENMNAESLFTETVSKITFGINSEIINKNKLSDEEKNYFISTIRQSQSEEMDLEIVLNNSEISVADAALINKLNDAKAELVLEEINQDKHPHLDYLKVSALSYMSLTQPRKKTIREKIQEIDKSIKSIEEKYSIQNSIKKIEKYNFYDRNIVNINNQTNRLWKVMKRKIDNYQISKEQYKVELTNKLLEDGSYDKKHFIEDMNKWTSENENILENIAEDINCLLKKFNLELTKIDENQNNYDGLIIRDLSSSVILKYTDLSTGTKNLLSTFIPLKVYSPKDSIILIDEPEMSFYPDIQRQLTDLYMSVGSNNQLVLATHSPLIASSFEPWEVVELKFDHNNQVYREKYYKDENHIGNYFVDPRLLTWTGILTNVFDLKEDSNFTFREKALMEYIRLERELKRIEDQELKKEKFEALMKLSDLLGLSGNEKDC